MISAWCRALLLSGGLSIVAAAATVDPPGGPPPPSPLPSEKDKWTFVRTAHFTLLGNSSVRRITDFGLRLERFRSMVGQLNKGFSADLPVPITIFVFDTEADYRPYKDRVGGKPADHIGYYLPQDDAAFITMLGHAGTDPLDIIYHEYTHAIMDINLASIPVWFGEGLAECYSTFRSGDEDHAEIGRPVPHHVATLRSRPALPLAQLFSVSRESSDYNEEDRSGVFYAESWALVHYLLWGNKDRRGQLGGFLTALADGQTPESAFASAFKTDFAGLWGEIDTYVKGDRFPFIAVTYKDLAFDRTTAPSPAARDEVLCRLGDLLRALGDERSADARRHYEEAIRLNPNHGRAHAGLAVVLEAGGERDRAVGLFEKALELAPRDDSVSIMVARSLLASAGAGVAPAPVDSAAPPAGVLQARALLEGVMLRQPGMVEPYVRFGRSFVNHEGNARRGIAALESALKLAPTRIDIMTDLVYLYLLAEDRLKAGTFVDRVLARAGRPESLAWARQALARYDRRHVPDTGTTASAQEDRVIPPASDHPAIRTRTAEEWRQYHTASLEAALAEATDPEVRRVIQGILEARRQSEPTDDYNAHIAAYNRAVALANQGKYGEAIALLEKELPGIKNDELAKTTRDLIARLKKDAARLKKQER